MINVVIVADKVRIPILMKHLPEENGISVIYVTESTSGLDAYIKRTQVIVLDVPKENAQKYIDVLKVNNIPIIAITDVATHGFALMGGGAAEMQLRTPGQMPQYFCRLLAAKIHAVSKREGGQKTRELKRPGSKDNINKLIVIGSSTGGTDTLEFILRDLPEDIPPILVVQHMPPIFTRMFAERLHTNCRINVWEAREGDPLMRGLALVAPGDKHMVLAKRNDGLYVRCIDGARVCNQRPSVDVLFESVAKILGDECSRAVGVILTGMGSDGAKGLLAMRKLGSSTIGQDEASCVVYGMPRAAYECGAVQRQLHKNDIASAILNFARGQG